MKEKTRDILKSIFNCQACPSIREFNSNLDTPIRPDFPLYDGEYPIITVGINPGWGFSKQWAREKNNNAKKKLDDNELEELWYKEKWKHVYEFRKGEYDINDKDLEDYISKVEKTNDDLEYEYKNIYKGQYTNTMCSSINKINQHLHVFSEEVEYDITSPYEKKAPNHLWKKSLWTNLSFCNSQKVDVRRIGGHALKDFHVFKDETPNCLRQGHLKSIVENFTPKLIIFFGSTILNHFKFTKTGLYPSILNMIFFPDKDPDEENNDFISNKCDHSFGEPVNFNKTSKTTIYVGEITSGPLNRTKLMFMPHPSARMGKKCREDAITYMCNKLVSSTKG